MKELIKKQLNYTLNKSTLENLGRHYKGKVRDVYKFYGTALKQNKIVSEAEFSAMITFK